MGSVVRVGIDAECLLDDFKSISFKRWKAMSKKILDGAPSEPMHGELLEGCRRITLGDHRCVFEILDHPDGYEWAWVIEVGHRNTVYDEPKLAGRRYRG